MNSKIIDIIGKALFPQRCRFCNTVIKPNETVCKDCTESLEVIDGKICTLCGMKEADCTCQKHRSYYTAIAAPYYYEGAAGKAVQALKFNKVQTVVEDLGWDMTVCFKERFHGYDFDLITFVPMTKKSEKERGFNQSELLAQSVAKETNIPIVTALRKVFETKPQHDLGELGRSGNVLGVFEVDEKIKPELENARILLIDDVKTTGATLNECAKTLLIGGAAEVFCLTATIAKKHNT